MPGENKIVVYHEDRAAADHVVKLLSNLGYESLRPETLAELQVAVSDACQALVIDSVTCNQRQSDLCDWLTASPFHPAAVILTDNASEKCTAVDQFEQRQIQTHVFPFADLGSDRFAQYLKSLAPPMIDHEGHAVGEDIAQDSVDASPKVKIIQSILHDIIGHGTLDSTMIISRSLPSKGDQCGEGADGIEDIFRLPTLALQGQSLAALAACHGAESGLGKYPAREALRAKVVDLRRCLEQELLATEIELVTPEMRLHPIASGNVLIGRPSLARNVDIAINCRWFSRGERSLYLSSEGSEWFIEDLGSANGSFIGEKRLEKDKRFSLPFGQTTIEIGRSLDRGAPVILNFNRASRDVVVISVSVGAAFDKSGSQTWPSLQEDLMKRWVVFREEFVIGAGELSNSLGFTPQEESAAITFGDGFWMTPLNGTYLRLDDRVFKYTVPLPLETDLEVGALRLRVVRARSSVVSQHSDLSADRASNG
jgi:hypothetical protein